VLAQASDGHFLAAFMRPTGALFPGGSLEAKRAALARERELFYSGGTLEEKEALEDVLYALHALKDAWQCSEAA
jgi:hypothetical protein